MSTNTPKTPKSRGPAAGSLPVIETLNKLPEVTWDRCTGDGEDHASVFGWIYRADGLADFVLVMIDREGPWLISTSSAQYSADFSERLDLGGSRHADCERVEHRYPTVRCVRQAENTERSSSSAAVTG